MIRVLGTFPITYASDGEDDDMDLYEGILNVSPSTAAFYNRLFDLHVVPGENSPLGDDESWWDERIDASSLGVQVVDPLGGPTGAFLVENLSEARKVLASEKVPLGLELQGTDCSGVVFVDPDKNHVAIFEITKGAR